MEIEYMQQVAENPTLDDFTNRGLSLENIINLEGIYNSGEEFPKALREFIYLAGDFNNIGFDDMAEGLDALQTKAFNELAYFNEKIDRPIFVFHQYSDCENFLFVYLDEEEEDPKTYVSSPAATFEQGRELIKHNGFTFSSLVNESIRRVKNDIPF